MEELSVTNHPQLGIQRPLRPRRPRNHYCDPFPHPVRPGHHPPLRHFSTLIVRQGDHLDDTSKAIKPIFSSGTHLARKSGLDNCRMRGRNRASSSCQFAERREGIWKYRWNCRCALDWYSCYEHGLEKKRNRDRKAGRKANRRVRGCCWYG